MQGAEKNKFSSVKLQARRRYVASVLASRILHPATYNHGST